MIRIILFLILAPFVAFSQQRVLGSDIIAKDRLIYEGADVVGGQFVVLAIDTTTDLIGYTSIQGSSGLWSAGNGYIFRSSPVTIGSSVPSPGFQFGVEGSAEIQNIVRVYGNNPYIRLDDLVTSSMARLKWTNGHLFGEFIPRLGIWNEPTESLDVPGTARLRGLQDVVVTKEKMVVADSNGVLKLAPISSGGGGIAIIPIHNGGVLSATYNNGEYIDFTSSDESISIGVSDDPTGPEIDLEVDWGQSPFQDNQKFDVAQLNGTNLELSLQRDADATKVIQLAGLQSSFDILSGGISMPFENGNTLNFQTSSGELNISASESGGSFDIKNIDIGMARQGATSGQVLGWSGKWAPIDLPTSDTTDELQNLAWNFSNIQTPIITIDRGTNVVFEQGNNITFSNSAGKLKIDAIGDGVGTDDQQLSASLINSTTARLILENGGDVDLLGNGVTFQNVSGNIRINKSPWVLLADNSTSPNYTMTQNTLKFSSSDGSLVANIPEAQGTTTSQYTVDYTVDWSKSDYNNSVWANIPASDTTRWLEKENYFYNLSTGGQTSQIVKGHNVAIESTSGQLELTATTGILNHVTDISLAQNGATNGQVYSWNGTAWAPTTLNFTDDQDIIGSSFNTANGQLTLGIENGTGQTISLDGRYLTAEVDGSTTNEIQDLTWNLADITNPALVLSGDPSAVLFKPGTNVTFSNASGSLEINAVGDGTGTDDQNIQGSGLTGTDLFIGIEGGTGQTVDLSSLQGTDDQNLITSFSTNQATVAIENGNSVTFLGGDNITIGNNSSNIVLSADDDQKIDTAQLVGTDLHLSLEGDGEAKKVIPLASLQDGTGTDDQQLSWNLIDNSRARVSLENGGSFDVITSGILMQNVSGDLRLSKSPWTLTADNSASPNYTISQNTLKFSSSDGSLIANIPEANGSSTSQYTVDYTVDWSKSPFPDSTHIYAALADSSAAIRSDFPTGFDGKFTSLDFTGTTGFSDFLDNEGSGSLWTQAGTEIYYNDNVGIRVTDPAASLHVGGSFAMSPLSAGGAINIYGTDPASRMGIFQNTNSLNSPAYISMFGDDATPSRYGEMTFSAKYIDFFANNDNTSFGQFAMRIAADRNVGIGVAAPAEKLHIGGKLRVNNIPSSPTSNQMLVNNGGVMSYRDVSTLPFVATETDPNSFYNANGTITGNRIVTLGTNVLQYDLDNTAGNRYIKVKPSVGNSNFVGFNFDVDGPDFGYVRYNSFGIDVSTSDNLYLTALGQVELKSESPVRIRNQGAFGYTLPNVTGNSGDILVLDGSNNLQWQAPSTGSTYTFQNGLTELAGGFVQLGGTLSNTTEINGGALNSYVDFKNAGFNPAISISKTGDPTVSATETYANFSTGGVQKLSISDNYINSIRYVDMQAADGLFLNVGNLLMMTEQPQPSIAAPADKMLVYNSTTQRVLMQPNIPYRIGISTKITNVLAATLNPSGSWSKLNIFSIPGASTQEQEWTSPEISFSNGTMTTNYSGRVEIISSVFFTTSVVRSAPQIVVRKNGAQIGTISSTGYVRNGNNHDGGSLYLRDEFSCSVGDTFEIWIRQDAAPGNIDMASRQCYFQAKVTR